jgi:hypothetical protein
MPRLGDANEQKQATTKIIFSIFLPFRVLCPHSEGKGEEQGTNFPVFSFSNPLHVGNLRPYTA